MKKLEIPFLLLLFIVLGCKGNQMIVNPPTPPPINNRIKSIAVDEANGQLVITGLFDSASTSQVFVDSQLLAKTFSSDSLIRANIPVSGKGSAGWVYVETKDTISNKKLLTYWHFWLYRSFHHMYSDGGFEVAENSDSINVRSDILSNPTVKIISCSKLSRLHARAEGSNGIHGYTYTGPKYDTVTTAINNFYINHNTGFDYYFTMPKTSVGGGDQSASIGLDKSYQVISYSLNDCGALTWECFKWELIAPTDFPPP